PRWLSRRPPSEEAVRSVRARRPQPLPGCRHTAQPTGAPRKRQIFCGPFVPPVARQTATRVAPARCRYTTRPPPDTRHWPPPHRASLATRATAPRARAPPRTPLRRLVFLRARLGPRRRARESPRPRHLAAYASVRRHGGARALIFPPRAAFPA